MRAWRLRWVALLVLFLMKTRRTPLYYAPGGGGTRGNTIFNVALACVLLCFTAAVGAYSGARLYRLRVVRRLRWADRSRAVAALQRQARRPISTLACPRSLSLVLRKPLFAAQRRLL